MKNIKNLMIATFIMIGSMNNIFSQTICVSDSDAKVEIRHKQKKGYSAWQKVKATNSDCNCWPEKDRRNHPHSSEYDFSIDSDYQYRTDNTRSEVHPGNDFAEKSRWCLNNDARD